MTMLSSALQKANTAVLLDNANNFEGAMEAYGDACVLLGHVMMRAAADDDKRKLMAIRDTYTRRIEELRTLSPLYKVVDQKELPATPLTQDFSDVDSFEQASTTPHEGTGSRPPPRRDSLLPGSAASRTRNSVAHTPRQGRSLNQDRHEVGEEDEASLQEAQVDRQALHERSMSQNVPQNGYATSSAFRPESGAIGKQAIHPDRAQHQHNRSISSGANLGAWSPGEATPAFAQGGHSRGGSDVSTSWFNTLEDSGGSVSGSSSRAGSRPGSSRSRIMQMRKAAKHENSSATAKRAQQEVIGAEMDAAVDAAWDGYGSDDDAEGEPAMLRYDGQSASRAPRNVAENGTNTAHERTASDESARRGPIININPLVRQDSESVQPYVSIGSTLTSPYTYSPVDLPIILDDRHVYSKIQQPEKHIDRAINTDNDKNHVELTAPLITNDTVPSSMQSSYIDIKSEAAQTNADKAEQIYKQEPLERVTSGVLSEDEDECMLEEMTRGYRLDDFQFDLNPPTFQTQEVSDNELSDWDNAANNSNLVAPGFSFQAKGEEEESSLSRPVSAGDSEVTASNFAHRASGVRDRRISARPLSMSLPLTIETAAIGTMPTAPIIEPARRDVEPDSPALSMGDNEVPWADEATDIPPNTATHKDENVYNGTIRSPTKTGPTLHTFVHHTRPDTLAPFEESPVSPLGRSNTLAAQNMRAPGGLRQMQSAQNLRYSTLGNLLTENMSPMASQFHPSHSSQYIRSNRGFVSSTPLTPGMAPLPLPTAGLAGGGYHLFDSKIHSPQSPRMENDLSANLPVPLEIMPSEPFSKPFWLMRCLAQTISHPRGGYLTTRLFVPRDIWLMKGVKIRGVEEKIAACDSLTVALSRLAVLDKSDADSLLHEMQELEAVMARAEITLSKKLGSDVGASGLASMLKGEQTGADSYGPSSDAYSNKNNASSSGGKGYLSWKKLRSKNSNSVINASYNNYAAAPKTGGNSFDAGDSTSSVAGWVGTDAQGGKNTSIAGPNAVYMMALTKLFDAAQVLDRLSIHLEGDNLHITTQVGLELVISRASEFFGLVICRFVLADVSLLLDKYIKRGTEWVAM